MPLLTIFSTKYVKNTDIAGGTALARRLRDTGRVTEDATIPQPPPTPRHAAVACDALCTSPVCLKNGLEYKS